MIYEQYTDATNVEARAANVCRTMQAPVIFTRESFRLVRG